MCQHLTLTGQGNHFWEASVEHTVGMPESSIKIIEPMPGRNGCSMQKIAGSHPTHGRRSAQPGHTVCMKTYILIYIPAYTRRWINVALTLVHRLRRWTNVKPTLIQRLVSAGMYTSIYVFTAQCDILCSCRRYIPRKHRQYARLLFPADERWWTNAGST